MLDIEFTNSLTPTLFGYAGEKEGDWWVFRKISTPNKENVSPVKEKVGDANESFKRCSTPISSGQSFVPMTDFSFSAGPSSRVRVQDNEVTPPPPWDSDDKLRKSISPSNVKTSFQPDEQNNSQNLETKPLISIHRDPDWLKRLKTDLFKEVIETCTPRTCQFVSNDQYIMVCVQFHICNLYFV